MTSHNALSEQICNARSRATNGWSERLWSYGCAALLVLTALGAGAARGETVVYGRVVAVEALHQHLAVTPVTGAVDCLLSAPARDAGLIARLRWDLEQRDTERSRCLAQRTPARYRVTYQWNGQLFTQELPFKPGERIALRLDVR